MKRNIFNVLIISLTVFSLISCSQLTASQANQVDENAINTSVALTVAAANATNPAIIITATPEQASLPTITAMPLSTVASENVYTPTAESTENTCYGASFKGDVTIPDGSKIFSGSTFVKTWRIQNVGTCTWTTEFSLITYSGDDLGAPAATALPSVVPPGGTIDLSVTLKAPASNGEYQQNFMLRSNTGDLFGTGANFTYPLYVTIEVIHIYSITMAPTIDFGSLHLLPLETSVYNFASEYCAAAWKNGSGALPCPGTTSDASGFIVRNDSPFLQDGSQYTGPTLFTHPQWIDNGTIAGFFPGIDIQDGYKFKTTLGCGKGGSACEALVQLNYSSDGGPTKNLDQWTIKYGDEPVKVKIDLSSLAGHKVKFILAVAAKGTSGQDWIQWVNPRIIK